MKIIDNCTPQGVLNKVARINNLFFINNTLCDTNLLHRHPFDPKEKIQCHKVVYYDILHLVVVVQINPLFKIILYHFDLLFYL